jgi:hypothetical protein
LLSFILIFLKIPDNAIYIAYQALYKEVIMHSTIKLKSVLFAASLTVFTLGVTYLIIRRNKKNVLPQNIPFGEHKIENMDKTDQEIVDSFPASDAIAHY